MAFEEALQLVVREIGLRICGGDEAVDPTRREGRRSMEGCVRIWRLARTGLARGVCGLRSRIGGGVFEDPAHFRRGVLRHPLSEEGHGEPAEVVVGRIHPLAPRCCEGEAEEFRLDLRFDFFEFVDFIFDEVDDGLRDFVAAAGVVGRVEVGVGGWPLANDVGEGFGEDDA